MEEGMELPLVVTDEIETITKTSEARKILMTVGLWEDIAKVSRSRKSRRGKTKHSVGPLLVVGDYKGAERAFKNFEGVNLVRAMDLSVEDLAPGTHPGRLTAWSESAIKVISARVW
jgi:large subunit ribosomal protein L4e